VATFDSALRLYFTNTEVRETNFKKLSGMNQLVRIVLAQHKGRDTVEHLKRRLKTSAQNSSSVSRPG
jgi:hypothetical protein